MKCDTCKWELTSRPGWNCGNLSHWKSYAERLEEKLEQKDDDRDKLDVAEWLLSYEKVHPYDCHGCRRHYEIPTHIDHFTCVCGHRCRLRHIGGSNTDQAVIDAAIQYFGNERSAQLAWIAEVVAGEHCTHYTADDIRKMFRQEMDRWQQTKDGWIKKK